MLWLESQPTSFAFTALLCFRQRGNGKAFRRGSEAPQYVGEEGSSGGKECYSNQIKTLCGT